MKTLKFASEINWPLDEDVEESDDEEDDFNKDELELGDLECLDELLEELEPVICEMLGEDLLALLLLLDEECLELLPLDECLLELPELDLWW